MADREAMMDNLVREVEAFEAQHRSNSKRTHLLVRELAPPDAALQKRREGMARKAQEKHAGENMPPVIVDAR